MNQIRLIFVGGFLGAGKTTLLAQATRFFVKEGKRVGIITNDQAANLVDSALLKQDGFTTEEVSGGCFCCRFDDFIAASGRLINEFKPDIVLGEPVGSCTDISATVLQPVKKLHTERFRVAPFSVVIDPVRLKEALEPKKGSVLPECALYIYRKQIEEADVIVLNKADMLSSDDLVQLKDMLARYFSDVPIVVVSALKGDGVESWLKLIAENKLTPGHKIAEVDYDTYADGEAVLGWLNAHVYLHANDLVDWKAFCVTYLNRLQSEFKTKGAEIVHLKLFLKEKNGYLAANLISNRADVSVRGNLKGTSQSIELTINARVRMDPADLRLVIEQCLDAVAGEKVEVDIMDIKSFKPGRPKPTHRFSSVV